MTSLMGNISLMEGEPFPHLHVTQTDDKLHLFGGHLTSAEIGVTGELTVEPFGGVLERKISQEIGLNLLALE